MKCNVRQQSTQYTRMYNIKKAVKHVYTESISKHARERKWKYPKPTKYKTVRKRLLRAWQIPSGVAICWRPSREAGTTGLGVATWFFWEIRKPWIRHFVEVLGKLSVTPGEDRTPPWRPSEEGTQPISDGLQFNRLRIYWCLTGAVELENTDRSGVRD